VADPLGAPGGLTPLDSAAPIEEDPTMTPLLALTPHAGARLAELAFLLLLIAGLWLVAAEMPQIRLGRARTTVAGLAIALGGLLLIIATHWGHFGA
jgi:hypothetical protein